MGNTIRVKNVEVINPQITTVKPATLVSEGFTAPVGVFPNLCRAFTAD
jgi:hypothetical protein